MWLMPWWSCGLEVWQNSLSAQVHFHSPVDSQTKPQSQERDVCMTVSFNAFVVNSFCRRTGSTRKWAKSWPLRKWESGESWSGHLARNVLATHRKCTPPWLKQLHWELDVWPFRISPSWSINANWLMHPELDEVISYMWALFVLVCCTFYL